MNGFYFIQNFLSINRYKNLSMIFGRTVVVVIKNHEKSDPLIWIGLRHHGLILNGKMYTYFGVKSFFGYFRGIW